ncbi:MAG: TIGR03905 family TSCPD domain-containing protein [Clostridia bacterium]|nr:TIGR03905 family TSCPD domain-containing protein [Clostridia bacterium]
MKYSYKTKNTCAVQIDFDMTDGIVSNIRFLGGCNGNLKMISKLLEGKRAEEIVSACSGNTCGGRATSCADQLAKAVQAALDKAE